MQKSFSVKKVFSLSWADFKAQWKTIILAFIPIFVVEILNGQFGLHEKREMGYGNFYGSNGPEILYPGSATTEGSLLATIILSLISIYLSVGLVRLILKIVDGKKANFKEVFTGPENIKHFIFFLLTYILLGIAIALPFLLISVLVFFSGFSFSLMIIGGIIAMAIAIFVALSLQFSYYLSIENRYHFFYALKKSWEMTEKNRLKLLALIILTALLNLLGLIPFGLGLLITVPITFLVYAHIYRNLDPEVQINEDKNISEDDSNENNPEMKDPVEETREEN